MKTVQRLDYERFAEELEQRGLVDGAALKHVLVQCMSSGQLFTELLQADGLIEDWELSRVACEVFNLAFISVESYEPSKEAVAKVDAQFLRTHTLVPLDLFGQVLTVAMPAMTPADVLSQLAQRCQVHVIPVVGSVACNRAWLDKNLARKAGEASSVAPNAPPAEEHSTEWLNLFDAADEQVQKSLGGAGKESVLPELDNGLG